MSRIHLQAVVSPQAELADDVEVGPFAVIGAGVEVEAGVIIGSHVALSGPARIGAGTRIFPFAAVGEMPSDLKYGGEPTRLEIGARNIIREGVTIHRGTVQGGGITRVGNDNLLMPYVHIAHDCQVGNQVIMANNASLAGHVIVGDYANLGGYTLVHQRCRFGTHGFSAKASVIGMDVPAFVSVKGHPAVPKCINREGLERRGFSDETINSLERAYRILYMKGLTREEALEQLRALESPDAAVQQFIQSVADPEAATMSTAGRDRG